MKIKKKKKHIEETFGEEIANFASHTAGAGLSIIALVILTIRASWARNPAAIFSFIVFSVGLIILYTMSSIYHGLKPGTAKNVLYFNCCFIYSVFVTSCFRTNECYYLLASMDYLCGRYCF